MFGFPLFFAVCFLRNCFSGEFALFCLFVSVEGSADLFGAVWCVAQTVRLFSSARLRTRICGCRPELDV